MLCVYEHQKYCISSSLYTSESAVYRRQILTYKDGPRAEGLNLWQTHPSEADVIRLGTKFLMNFIEIQHLKFTVNYDNCA